MIVFIRSPYYKKKHEDNGNEWDDPSYNKAQFPISPNDVYIYGWKGIKVTTSIRGEESEWVINNGSLNSKEIYFI